MRSKNSGVEEKNENDNPFLVNDPAIVWEEWKKKGKPISREELEKKLKEAVEFQKKKGKE